MSVLLSLVVTLVLACQPIQCLECNQVFSGHKSGEFKSPNYPNKYPSNQVCNYHIQAPYYAQVTLHLNRMEFERYPRDFLLVFDGPNCFGKRLAVFNRYINWPISSQSRDMNILFASNGRIEGIGFSANFTIDYDISPARLNYQSLYFSPTAGAMLLECGGTLRAQSMTIKFPRNVRLPAVCIWLIEGMHDQVVQLTVNTLKPRYTNSWLKALDGQDCSAKELLHVDGTNVGESTTVTSNGSHMVVIYTRYYVSKRSPPVEFSYELIKPNKTKPLKPLSELTFFYASDHVFAESTKKSSARTKSSPGGVLIVLASFCWCLMNQK